MSKKIEYLFKELAYSEIDIKFEISSGHSGTEVGYVLEGYDGWGNKYHLSSGINDSFASAVKEVTNELERRLKELIEEVGK